MADSRFPFNVVLPIPLAFVVVALYWLIRSGMEAGAAYMWLFVIGFIIIIVAALAHRAGAEFWYEIPIDRTAERSIFMLYLGVAFILLLATLPLLIPGLSKFYSPAMFTSFMTFTSDAGAQTFAAISIETSPFWKVFNYVIAAPFVEEFVLGFAFVALGSLIGLSLRTFLSLNFSGGGNEAFDFVVAMAVSVALFAVLHTFNGTYLNFDGSWNLGMFRNAAMFRLLMNVLIYKFANVGLMFSLGAHATSNALGLAPGVFMAGLLTFPGGFILLAFFVLITYYAVTHAGEIVSVVREAGKDFITFD